MGDSDRFFRWRKPTVDVEDDDDDDEQADSMCSLPRSLAPGTPLYERTAVTAPGQNWPTQKSSEAVEPISSLVGFFFSDPPPWRLVCQSFALAAAIRPATAYQPAYLPNVERSILGVQWRFREEGIHSLSHGYRI